MTLYQRIRAVNSTNPHFQKDLKKALDATCFIGRGSLASSTHKYMVAAGELANKGQYNSNDIVFVSAEGNRRGRLSVDYDELLKAIEAQVVFVTDNKYNRNTSYNIGEKEVEQFLLKHQYADTNGNGIWKKSDFST